MLSLRAWRAKNIAAATVSLTEALASKFIAPTGIEGAEAILAQIER
jgi:hypothetical protein